MKHSRAFTLIEILIALMVFAILATVTASSLYHAFNTRSRVNAQAERLTSLQLAISLMQQDFIQVVERPVRGNDMSLFPAFIGQEQYVEFTRDGLINPGAIEQRSSLKRIALLCDGGQLLQRTWSSLDSPDRNHYEDRVLMEKISDCHFNYLTRTLQTLTQWREQAISQNQIREPLPKAVQVNFTVENWGELNMLFLIPGAVYATT